MMNFVYIKNEPGLATILRNELNLYLHTSAILPHTIAPYLVIDKDDVHGVTGNNIEKDDKVFETVEQLKEYIHENKTRNDR